MNSTKITEVEYQALIEGLKKAIRLGISELEIRGDSQTVFHQITGRAGADKEHKPLRDEVTRLLDLIPSYTLRQVPSKENEAHDLAYNNTCGDSSS